MPENAPMQGGIARRITQQWWQALGQKQKTHVVLMILYSNMNDRKATRINCMNIRTKSKQKMSYPRVALATTGKSIRKMTAKIYKDAYTAAQ